MITLDAVCSLFHGPLGVSCLDVHPGYCFWLWTHNSCFVQQLGLSLYPIHWVPSYRPLVASEKPCGEWHWRCDGSWCIVLKIFEVSIFWHQKHKNGIWFKECNREPSRLQQYNFGHPQQKMSCDQLNKMLPERPSLEKNASGDRFLVRDNFDPAHMTGHWPCVKYRHGDATSQKWLSRTKKETPLAPLAKSQSKPSLIPDGILRLDGNHLWV